MLKRAGRKNNFPLIWILDIAIYISLSEFAHTHTTTKNPICAWKYILPTSEQRGADSNPSQGCDFNLFFFLFRSKSFPHKHRIYASHSWLLPVARQANDEMAQFINPVEMIAGVSITTLASSASENKITSKTKQTKKHTEYSFYARETHTHTKHEKK